MIASVSKYVSATELKQSESTPQSLSLEAHTISKALDQILQSHPQAEHFTVELQRAWYGTTVVVKIAPDQEHAND